MDSSLKQRLLGAAVLIALAVIFVPMFMSDSAPRKSAEMETTNLAIPPAPDREFQQRVLPVEPAPAAGAPSAPATSPEPVAETAPALPEPVSPPAATPPASEAAPAATSPAPVGATPPPAAAKPPAPGTAADTRYFVHLGVYAEVANATELAASLKKGGQPAFTEPTRYQGKPAARVRVGPYASRAAAESARLRIRELKPSVPGSVIQLASDVTADAPASALAPTRAGAWAVQLGAFKAQADANKLRDRLRGSGFASFVDKVESNGATLWRVRAGPEVDRAAADTLRADIHERVKVEGIIVQMQ